jgi:CheY-like chemotaxis protein
VSFLNAEEVNSYNQSRRSKKVPLCGEGYDLAETTAFIAGKHCLVIDDEFLIALDIQQTLEAAGAAVTCIGDADAALAALTGGGRFDFAILDIKLSDFTRDSTSIASVLTERGTPFVFLTGMRADNEMAKGFPQAPLVEKPYQVETLMEALRRALGGR